MSPQSADPIGGLLAGLPSDLAVLCRGQRGAAGGAIVDAGDDGRYLDSGAGKGICQGRQLGTQTSTAGYLMFGKPDSRPTAAVIGALVDDRRIDPTCVIVSAVTVDERGCAELGVAGKDQTLRRRLVRETFLALGGFDRRYLLQEQPGRAVGQRFNQQRFTGVNEGTR